MKARVDIAGVVVTFHPDDAFEHRLQAIARETRPVIVVDNTNDEAGRARLEAICARASARLIANDRNRGLASALNQAFAALAAQGHAWAFAFDQDSTPAAGFAAAAFACAQSHPASVVVGANWEDEARPGWPARHLQARAVGFARRPAETDLIGVTCVVTSGSLFNLAAWGTLGGFDDALFLDLVDTEYCLRAQAAGHEIGVAAKARLLHRRGAKRGVRCCGRTWWPAFMPPLRLRYLFRNRVLVFRRHGWRFPHWVAFELAFAGKILTEISLFEDRKWAKFAACWSGTWDGLLGRAGKVR